MLNKCSSRLLTSLCFALCLVVHAPVLHAEDPPPLTHNLTEINPPLAIPELKLPDMDDKLVDIESMKGKVVVVNFWATWCSPCRREMASLENLYQETKDKNVEVIAVNVGEDTDTVFPFINSLDVIPTFAVLLDKDSSAMKRWKARSLPTTYVVNAEGKVIYRAVGGREFDHPDVVNKIQSGLASD